MNDPLVRGFTLKDSALQTEQIQLGPVRDASFESFRV